MERLPLDIAREILESTAWKCRDSILSLLLVSRQVHSWIEPILYKVIRLMEHEQFYLLVRTIAMKTDAGTLDVITKNAQVLQYGSTVGLRVPFEYIVKIAQTCKNAKYIWIPTDFTFLLPLSLRPVMLAALREMKLQRLRIFGLDVLSRNMLLSGASATVTHLIVETLPIEPLQLSLQPDPLPHLSHLLFYFGNSYWPLLEVNKVFNLLAQRPKLIVCGVVHTSDIAKDLFLRLDIVRSGDPRFILVEPSEDREADWVSAYYGHQDLFSIAEAQSLALRKSSETPHNENTAPMHDN